MSELTQTSSGARTVEPSTSSVAADDRAPSSTHVLEARGLVKTFGHVIGLAGVDLHLDRGEVLGVIGDNGAGKSTLIKCLSGAYHPDRGEILLEGKPVTFKSPLDAKLAGIETVYQTLAVSPALDIASNMYLGREIVAKGILGKVFRKLDSRGMRQKAKEEMTKLGIATLQDMAQRVEVLSGGQRQAVAVARAAAFGSKVVILDEPTAALGVRESNQVLDLIRSLREHGLPVILISHNMPQVWQVADRVHIQRLGHRAGVISTAATTAEEAVAIMTGAKQLAPAA
jgi:fructose transport system ATP-binding protein